MKSYSAFSALFRGEEERSSPVFGFKEKRSALEPLKARTNGSINIDKYGSIISCTIHHIGHKDN